MIENIFSLKIYKTVYPETKKLQEMLVPLLESVFEKTVNNNQGSMRGGLCSYNSVRDLHTWPELKHFNDFIKSEVDVYWKELNYSQKHGPHIYEMWANKYDRNSFIDAHTHSPIAVTSSFYLKKPKDSGNIVFEHPLDDLLKHQPYENLQNRNNYHCLFDHEVNVSEGDIVFFPGWFKHKTKPNLSDQERIIIGTNIISL